ncbi:putative serine/threonine-protein kinase [Operophtera brumata]|uniref:Putative serine/threonine-protein kinase n=1 Tax=Operophtera brumata TaxID=104452 RepID=A0A0L7LJN7_OPEBR|nr:putative serine/threonine-protein kinase [Operophtera brumata]
MNSGNRRALTGSIHKVREFELEKVSLVEEFDILQIVGEGWFGKILLVEHRASDTEIVLKALPKPYVCIRDFYREFHYSLHLSAHKNIVTTFDVAFETAGFYVFCQEYAPLGDLTSNMLDTGIGEIHTKRVAKQLAAALEHLHQRDLVHRDVKLDNILIFKSDFSRIKLCDFGETRKVQSAVRRRNEWLPYSPPEVLKLSMDSSYKALITHDVWQFGIVIFICLTGCLPWQKAAFDDPRYTSYYSWYNSSNPLRKQPKLWKMVSSRAQRMFKKFIEPREEKRDNGIETTVDRQAKKQRIREWIQNSVIEEADEEHRTRNHPIDEAHRVTLRFDTERHINPRTGEVIDGLKHQQVEKNPLSYDVQNIEPVAPDNVVRRYGVKEEGSSHSSTKDSAYGSMEAKVNPRTAYKYNTRHATTSIDSSIKNSPSRSLSAVSINQSIPSNMTNAHAQRIQRSEEVYSKELESLKGSSSTLHSLANSSRSNSLQVTQNSSLDSSSKAGSGMAPTSENNTSPRPNNPVVTQNGFSPGVVRHKPVANPKYVSLKSTVYDNVNTRNETNTVVDVPPYNNQSPYTSMINIVQGQIKISPHENEINRNVVNVSVTPVARNKKS